MNLTFLGLILGFIIALIKYKLIDAEDYEIEDFLVFVFFMIGFSIVGYFFEYLLF